MNIIDRYVLRQYIQTFLICYLSLTGLYIVFGAFTNLDSFLKAAEGHGGLLAVVATYYGYQSLFFFDLTAGMLALIAAMFTVTWLQRHNEMTALMAAGIPRVRAVMPVIVAAISVALLATVNRELIMPCCRNELARQPSDLTGENARLLEPRYDARTDVLLRGGYSYAQERRISKPDFQLPDTLGDYGKHLIAESAFYQPPVGNRPGGYLLRGVSQPKLLSTLPSLPPGGEPILITPRDADWLKPNECFLASDVSFDLLTQGVEFASTAQLIAGLRNPSLDFGAAVRVEIHSRIVQPLLDITLLFLGLPLVVSRQNRNVFVAIGLCILVVSVFVVVTIALESLGASYLIPPHLAAWAPLLIFVPIAVGIAGTMWE
jgi:lipopolysaccharide export system permease protein